MQRLEFNTTINASRQKVWHTLLGEQSYREWASEFMPGSHFQGSWDKGSRIYFKSPEGDGMISLIKENKPYELLSIEHQGTISKGVEDFDGEEARKWQGTLETYRLNESDGKTTLTVEQDIVDDYVDYFNTTWPKALARVKKLAEE